MYWSTLAEFSLEVKVRYVESSYLKPTTLQDIINKQDADLGLNILSASLYRLVLSSVLREFHIFVSLVFYFDKPEAIQCNTQLL